MTKWWSSVILKLFHVERLFGHEAKYVVLYLMIEVCGVVMPVGFEGLVEVHAIYINVN